MSNVEQENRRLSDAETGLCAHCAHAREIQTTGRSAFVRCGRSDADPHFPRYPTLPMHTCTGYEPGGTHRDNR